MDSNYNHHPQSTSNTYSLETRPFLVRPLLPSRNVPSIPSLYTGASPMSGTMKVDDCFVTSLIDEDVWGEKKKKKKKLMPSEEDVGGRKTLYREFMTQLRRIRRERGRGYKEVAFPNNSSLLPFLQINSHPSTIHPRHVQQHVYPYSE